MAGTLLGRLSNKTRAEIAATNRGEKRLEATAPTEEKAERQASAKTPRGNPARSGAIDPTKLESMPNDFFIDMVSAQDNIAEEKRSNKNYSHVSSLLKNPCARKQRILDESEQIDYESATGGHRVMWLIGRAVEKHIRDSYIKAIKGKGVLGKWHCKCEQTTYEGLYEPKTKACPFCRTTPNQYAEMTLFDHEFGICGNPDMLLYIGADGLLYVVEIKSMNGEDYDDLTRPMPDHTYQAGAYRRMLEKMGYPVSDKLLIIYCTKKFKFGKPYKQFTVDANQQHIVAVLDGMWAAAKEIHDARKAKELPPRERCASPNVPEAKKCVSCVECFSRRT